MSLLIQYLNRKISFVAAIKTQKNIKNHGDHQAHIMSLKDDLILANQELIFIHK